MAESGRATKSTHCEIVQVRHLSPVDSSNNSMFLPSSPSTISLWPYTILAILALLGFIALGVLSFLTWGYIENEHVFIAGVKSALGIIGSVILVISLCAAKRPEGIGIFAGFYILMILIPVVLVNGIILAFFASDNSDYFTAISADEDLWTEKYQDTSVEDATDDAD